MNTPTLECQSPHASVNNRISQQIEQAISAWPTEIPLYALCSDGESDHWSRWTILAQPAFFVSHIINQKTNVVQTNSLPETHRKQRPNDQLRFTNDPLADLAVLFDHRHSTDARADESSACPFLGGWIGSISYDLGAVIESTAKSPSKRQLAHIQEQLTHTNPLFEFAWCEDGLQFDHLTGEIHEFGRPPVSARTIEDLPAFEQSINTAGFTNADFELGDFIPEQTREAVERAVTTTIEYIRAGDIFQANISQRFFAPFKGNRRALLASALHRNPARYLAYLESSEDRSILSLSPELFLSFDSKNRNVITRPIKGTAPSTDPPNVLHNSLKDEAELNMIVDLMRNDLGKVCDPGSVQVLQKRVIETYRTVHHGVATVQGQLQRNHGLAELLLATLAGGSITGAPKIRAMQIIDELEPFVRGPFFGSIGFVDRSGSACFNLAIRTMLIEKELATYTAGAGIVADSDPTKEYDEMLLKAQAASILSRPRNQTIR